MTATWPPSLGYEAVITLLNAKPEDEPVVVGTKANRITRFPLMECVEKTRAVAEAIAAKDYEKAMSLRSTSFKDAFSTLKTMVRALPHPPAPGQKRFRIGVFNAGAPAPGMNTAARAAIRLGLDQGHIMLGVSNGFEGSGQGRGRGNELDERERLGFAGRFACWEPAALIPQGSDLYAIARAIEDNHIDALLVIGGWNGYEGSPHHAQLRGPISRPSTSRSSACRLRSTTTCPAPSSASARIRP